MDPTRRAVLRTKIRPELEGPSSSARGVPCLALRGIVPDVCSRVRYVFRKFFSLPSGKSFAPFDPSHRRQQRDVHVHLLLADGGRGALRPGQHGLLHRRHRGRGDRPRGPVVHPGRDDLQLRRALDLYRKLLAVRSRRRLPRGQGSHGRVPRQALGLGADVRLYPHRADQRRIGRANTSWGL